MNFFKQDYSVRKLRDGSLFWRVSNVFFLLLATFLAVRFYVQFHDYRAKGVVPGRHLDVLTYLRPMPGVFFAEDVSRNSFPGGIALAPDFLTDDWLRFCRNLKAPVALTMDIVNAHGQAMYEIQGSSKDLKLELQVGCELGTSWNCTSYETRPRMFSRWVDFMLRCESKKQDSQLSNSKSGVTFSLEAPYPVALLQGKCERPSDSRNEEARFLYHTDINGCAASLKPQPAIRLWVPRFQDDILPISVWQSFNYGGLQSFPLAFLGYIALIVLFAWAALKKIGPEALNIAAFLVPFLFLTATLTPPYQYADEPDHALGFVQQQFAAPDQSQIVMAQKEAGNRTQFYWVTKSRNQPVLPGIVLANNFEGEDSPVTPSQRSYPYGLISSISASVLKSFGTAWHLKNSLNQDPGWWIRITNVFIWVLLLIMFYSLLRVFVGQKRLSGLLLISAVVFFLPSVVANVAAVSNYGVAILLGCISTLSIWPHYRFRFWPQVCLLCLGVTTSPLLFSAAKPLAILMIVWPIMFCFTLCSLLLRQTQEIREDLSRVKTIVLKNITAWGVIFFNLLCCVFGYNDLWNHLKFEGFGRLWNAIEEIAKRSDLNTLLEKFPHAMSLSDPRYFLLTYFGTLLLLVLVINLAAVGFCKMGSGSIQNAFQSKFTLALALLAKTGAACAVLVYVLFPILKGWNVSYARNLWGGGAAQISYQEFAKESVQAVWSQAFTFQQDYFLVETLLSGWGWLDTTLPPICGFIFRQAIHGGLAGVLLMFFFGRARRALFLTFGYGLPVVVLWFAMLFGAYSEGHTLIGRYLLPCIGFLLILPVLGWQFWYHTLKFMMRRLGFSFPQLQDYWLTIRVAMPEPLHLILALVIAFNIYGVFWLLPVRFIIGGDYPY